MDKERIEQLERRLQHLEDHLELNQLLSAFGPVTDTGSPDDISQFYTEDGEYNTDVPGSVPAQGREAIAALFDTPMHKQATSGGSGHTVGFPHLTVRGDEAEGICYTILFLNLDQGWMVARVAANHLWFERTPGGWQIKKRMNRLLGSDEARGLFSEAPKSLSWIGGTSAT